MFNIIFQALNLCMQYVLGNAIGSIVFAFTRMPKTPILNFLVKTGAFVLSVCLSGLLQAKLTARLRVELTQWKDVLTRFTKP